VASPIHSVLPRLAIGLVPLVLGAGAYVGYRHLTHVYDVPRGADIFRVVEGKWARTLSAVECDSSFIAIRFTPSRGDMIVTRPHPVKTDAGLVDTVTRYPVLGHTRHSIRVASRGETVMGPDGVPVVWDLMLRSPNSYVWHRSDWVSIQFSTRFHRCRTP
jgi:hypothetical protein